MVREREKPKITHRFLSRFYYYMWCNVIRKHMTIRPTHTEVRKGDTIRLVCGATGYPPPTFQWYKDGGRLSNVHDRYEARHAKFTQV